MIITQNTTSVAKAIDNVVNSYHISAPYADHVFSLLSTKLSMGSMKNTADRMRIMKLNRLQITSEHLSAANIGAGDDLRPSKFTVGSIELMQSLHPTTISLSVSMMDQSALAFSMIVRKLLSGYVLDLREIKLGLMLMKSATIYNSKFGSNNRSPSELTIKDLNSVTTLLRNRGMAPILSQYMASTNINTSGVPKSFILVASNSACAQIMNDLDLSNLKSFISTFQYSGSTNYAHNVRGCETTSGVSIVSSNLFNPVTTEGSYKAILLSGDCYISGIDNPTSDSLIVRDPLISSATGLRVDFSVRSPVSQAVSRPEGIFEINSTNK